MAGANLSAKERFKLKLAKKKAVGDRQRIRSGREAGEHTVVSPYTGEVTRHYNTRSGKVVGSSEERKRIDAIDLLKKRKLGTKPKKIKPIKPKEIDTSIYSRRRQKLRDKGFIKGRDY